MICASKALADQLLASNCKKAEGLRMDTVMVLQSSGNEEYRGLFKVQGDACRTRFIDGTKLSETACLSSTNVRESQCQQPERDRSDSR